MKIGQIAKELSCKIVTGHHLLDTEVYQAFASDLMSDVLTIEKSEILLVTGLSNLQTIRTAEMADISCIIIVRNKQVFPEMVELANRSNMIILEYPGSLFKACGHLYNIGIRPIY